MRFHLIAAAIVLTVAACGGSRTIEKTEAEKTAARGGVSQEVYDDLRGAATARFDAMSLTDLEALETRDCRGLVPGEAKAECVASNSAWREATRSKREAAREADPRGACVSTRLLMGASQTVAEARCDALTAACQSEFAAAKRNSAGRTRLGLLGALGSGSFTCKAADQIEFAGEIFTNRRPVDLLAGRTIMSHDPCHGAQIEYLDPDGRSYLWYPGNANVVRGRWETINDNDDPRVRISVSEEIGGQFCQKTDGPTFNPATQRRGDEWTCTPLFLITGSKVANREGDPFGLSKRTEVPYDLSDGPPPEFSEFVEPFPNAQCVGGRVRRLP